MSDRHGSDSPRGGRSREELLATLFETATDIAARHDVEDVLQAIVRRTRAFLGTDMAYISLTDLEGGETYIRQTDGVTTHGYRTLRQPLGTGVLGQIALGVAPYQSRDYLADPALRHLPEIDAIVRAEGVRAIMGVPLAVGGRALGALVVAERRPRTFTPEEIDDVDSIGRHAAVALDNSMRIAELESLAADLEREKDQRAAQLEMISAMLDLDTRLVETVSAAPDPARLLAVGRSALGSELRLRAPGGSVLAATADFDDERERIPVRVRGEALGVLSSADPLDSSRRALLDRVAAHCALALMFRRAQDDADLRLQTEVLGDLFARPDAPHEHLERWLGRWGIGAGEDLWVVVLEAPVGERTLRLAEVRARSSRAVMMASHEEHICLVTADADWAGRLRALFAEQGWALRAGASGPFSGAARIADAHSRAQLAYGSAAALGRPGIVDAAELGMLGALLALARRGELPGSLTASVDPLVAYDRERGTHLVRTAFAYLECDGDVGRAARMLHVHRNTVRQRLDRIDRLLGETWKVSPRRLDTHLALRALDAAR